MVRLGLCPQYANRQTDILSSQITVTSIQVYLYSNKYIYTVYKDTYTVTSTDIKAQARSFLQKMKGFILSEVNEMAHLCPNLCSPMDYGLPGFFIHGIFQARVLEWAAISILTECEKKLWTV